MDLIPIKSVYCLSFRNMLKIYYHFYEYVLWTGTLFIVDKHLTLDHGTIPKSLFNYSNLPSGPSRDNYYLSLSLIFSFLLQNQWGDSRRCHAAPLSSLRCQGNHRTLSRPTESVHNTFHPPTAKKLLLNFVHLKKKTDLVFAASA